MKTKLKNKNCTLEVFPFSYDGLNRDFCQELIRKNNELFHGTEAEIGVEDSGPVLYMHEIHRLGLSTTINKASELKKEGYWPITPEQSERFLKYLSDNKLHETVPWDNFTYRNEDLALILYDLHPSGENAREASYLDESIERHKESLGLRDSTLEKELIVVNAGIERHKRSPNYLFPVILPGVTQVYSHEIFKKSDTRVTPFLGYGLRGGLPLINQRFKDTSQRRLYFPSIYDSELGYFGLRVLRISETDLDLSEEKIVNHSVVLRDFGDNAFIPNREDVIYFAKEIDIRK